MKTIIRRIIYMYIYAVKWNFLVLYSFKIWIFEKNFGFRFLAHFSTYEKRMKKQNKTLKVIWWVFESKNVCIVSCAAAAAAWWCRLVASIRLLFLCCDICVPCAPLHIDYLRAATLQFIRKRILLRIRAQSVKFTSIFSLNVLVERYPQNFNTFLFCE